MINKENSYLFVAKFKYKWDKDVVLGETKGNYETFNSIQKTDKINGFYIEIKQDDNILESKPVEKEDIIKLFGEDVKNAIADYTEGKVGGISTFHFYF